MVFKKYIIYICKLVITFSSVFSVITLKNKILTYTSLISSMTQNNTNCWGASKVCIIKRSEKNPYNINNLILFRAITDNYLKISRHNDHLNIIIKE